MDLILMLIVIIIVVMLKVIRLQSALKLFIYVRTIRQVDALNSQAQSQ